MGFDGSAAGEYLTRDEARALLADGLEEGLRDAIRAGFKRYKAGHPVMLALPSKTLRALTVHEIIVDEIRNRLGDHPRVRVFDAQPGGRRFLVGVIDKTGIIRLLLHVKKLNANRGTTNYPTRTARAFVGQLPLAGVPAGVRLAAGYREIEEATDIVPELAYELTRGRVLWHFELGGTASVEQLQLNPQPDAAPRVRAKPGVVPGSKQTGTKGGKNES